MGIVRRPMGIGGWVRVDIYSEYAQMAQWNLQEGRYFEAVLVSVVCLDVLTHHMVDGLLLHRSDELNTNQIAALQSLEERRLTAGQVIDELEAMCVLPRPLLSGLKRLNQIRKAVVHPFEKGTLKSEAIVPGIRITKEQASYTYSLLCRVIDVAGGQSPLREKKVRESYMHERQREREKLR